MQGGARFFEKRSLFHFHFSTLTFISQLTWGSRTAFAIDDQLARRSTAKIERGLGTERARLGSFRGFNTERARLGIFRGFGTERARLGTFRGFGTERARLGTFRGFLIFFVKTSKFDSKSPLVIVKLGVDFRKIPYLLCF